MKKRLISLLTVMAMLIGIIPVMTVSAASVATKPSVVYGELWDMSKWSVTDKTTGFTYSQNAKWQVSVSTAQAYEGQRSLHIYWDDPIADGTSEWPSISIDSKQKFPAGTYTFTMYQYAPKGTDPLINGFANFMVLDADGKKNNIWAEGAGIAENPDKLDWLKYSKTITLSKECELKFIMNFKSYADRGPYDMYLDNLSFVNTNNPGVNLLEGSMSTFERAETESDIESNVWAVYRQDSTAVGYNYTVQKSSAYAASGDNSLHLGWHLHEGTRFSAWAAAKINYRETMLAQGDYLFSCKVKGMTDFVQLKFNTGSLSGTRIPTLTQYASEADSDGWITYTDIPFSMTSEGNFELIMNGDCTSECYLDDIVITRADDASKTNILSYYASTFDEEPVEIDDTAEALNEKLWDVYKGGTDKSLAETTAKESFDGTRSLHLKNVSGTESEKKLNIWALTKIPSGNYTMTAYVKEKSVDNWVGMTFTNWTGTDIENATHFKKEETAVDGWYKYTITADIDDTNGVRRPTIYLWNKNTGGVTDIYVDGLTLVNNATGIDVLGGIGSFDEPASDPLAGELDMNVWQYSGNGAEYAVAEPTAKYAYEGENSLRIKKIHGSGATNYTNFWYKQNTLAAGTYKMSARVKTAILDQQSGSYVAFALGDGGGASNPWVGVKLNSGASNITVGEPDENGWVEYTMTATVGSAGPAYPMIIIESPFVAEIYVDNLTVIREGSTKDVLLGAGTFDDILAFPDITGKSIDTSFWNMAHNQTEGAETEVIGETSMETAFDGRRSLHIKRVGNGKATNIWPRTAMLEAGKEYTMTAYIKTAEDDTNSGNVKMTFGSWQATAVSTLEKDTETGKPGWVKYELTATVGSSYPNGPMIYVDPASGKTVDIYVDNISIYATDDASRTNLLVDGTTGKNHGSFEAEPGIAPTFEASPVKLFDADMNEITELTASLSGKEVTAAAAVMNESAGSEFTGQIILCVYDGLEMKYSSLSEVQTIAEGDGATLVTSTIKLPEFEEVGNLKVKVFLWDSATGMYPLIDEVAEF